MTRRRRLKPLDLECPYCGAKEGRKCRTRDGYEIPRSFHTARRDQAALLNYVDARAEQAGQL